MKHLILSTLLALLAPAAWAAGDWNCGPVNGQNFDIYAGPALVINGGARNELTRYSVEGTTVYYHTADLRYIWGGNDRVTNLYDGNATFLASCKRSRSGTSSGGWFKDVFPDNNYGGMRGDEFIP